jgi:hypothetical protein
MTKCYQKVICINSLNELPNTFDTAIRLSIRATSTGLNLFLPQAKTTPFRISSIGT